MVLPLDGIKVVELGIWVAGPTCARVLGELGADVIKIENPRGGDPARGVVSAGAEKDSVNPLWELYNGSKRSIAIDLTQAAGKEIVYKLVKASDVLVTNMRPGALERLALDYETVAKINPRIIYAQNTGFGIKGPDRDRPAFDSNGFWIRSGIMSTLGQPDSPPVPLRGAMGDLPTALFLVAAIGMAILAREKLGVGQKIDISLMSSGMWVAAEDIQQRLIWGERADNQKHSREKVSNPLWNIYRTKDKWFELILLETERFWPPFCKAIEREDLEKDPRFDTDQKRAKNNELLISIIDEVLATRTMKEWGERFDQYGLVWAAETPIAEVLADPQVSQNGFIAEVQPPSDNSFKLLRIPFQFSKTPVQPRKVAPKLGQHTEEVLLELGYDRTQLSRLKGQGVIV